MAERECSRCGRPLEPEAPKQRRLCRRDDCLRERHRDKIRRQRAARTGTVVEFPGAGVSAGETLVDAVRAALDELGQSDSWEGRNALSLAERMMSAGRESGSAFAALSAKLESAMDRALRPRPGESFVDDLRRRRAERLGG